MLKIAVFLREKASPCRLGATNGVDVTKTLGVSGPVHSAWRGTASKQAQLVSGRAAGRVLTGWHSAEQTPAVWDTQARFRQSESPPGHDLEAERVPVGKSFR